MAKKRILILVLLLTLLLFSCNGSPYEPGVPVENIPFEVLGTPSAEKYPDGAVARCPWDMILFDGKLYLGSGDYDVNAGPADIYAYDPVSGSFEVSGTVPDEEVSRFCILYDELAAPGIDPKEEWDLGNYYTLKDGVWHKNRVIPGGIHVFDIVEFRGMLFAGLGVLAGEYPISFSLDGGETFESVLMRKNGIRVKTDENDVVRTYDLFVCNDTLYATFTYGGSVYELYRYDEEKHVFHYVCDWSNTLKRIRYKYARIGEKVLFDDVLFFTTGYLYRADDIASPEEINMPDGTVVCDIFVANGAMYLLCGKKEADGGIKTTVMRMKDAASCELETLFSFTYDIPPMSLVVSGEDFYIGMGSGTTKNEKNGTLLYVNYPLFKD